MSKDSKKQLKAVRKIVQAVPARANDAEVQTAFGMLRELFHEGSSRECVHCEQKLNPASGTHIRTGYRDCAQHAPVEWDRRYD